ncbi:MAG: nuclear transport factor 2 family protein [Jatrophihabitantaceae bacterium]
MDDVSGTPPAQAVAVLAEHVAAFNAYDLPRLMAGFAADASWVTGRDALRGTGNLSELFDAAFAGLSPQLEIVSVLVNGDRVAAELLEHIELDGQPREFAIAGFYRIAAGRIVAAKIYREGSADVA